MAFFSREHPERAGMAMMLGIAVVISAVLGGLALFLIASEQPKSALVLDTKEKRAKFASLPKETQNLLTLAGRDMHAGTFECINLTAPLERPEVPLTIAANLELFADDKARRWLITLADKWGWDSLVGSYFTLSQKQAEVSKLWYITHSTRETAETIKAYLHLQYLGSNALNDSQLEVISRNKALAGIE